MENEYKAIANFEGGIGRVFNRCFKSEGFSIILSEGNLLIAKKGDDNNVNVEYERIISEQVRNKTNKCDSKGVLYLDLTEEYSNIMNSLETKKIYKILIIKFLILLAMLLIKLNFKT